MQRRPSRSGNRPEPASGPFTASDLDGMTWTRAARRHAVASGRFTRLRPGVYDAATAVDPARHLAARAVNLQSARATVRLCDRAVPSHASAAISLGLPTLGYCLSRPCVTVQSGTALRELAAVHLHRACLTDDMVRCGSEWVTSAARTVLDVAREHGVDAGVVAADHALRKGLASPVEFAAVLRRCSGWPRIATARRVAELANGLAESPLESLSRLRMDAVGLPAPVLQAQICDEHGVVVARSDFYWPEHGVVGEADGNLKYVRGMPAIVAQARQQRELERLGLLVVRWGWHDVRDFGPTVRRLRLALERGSRPDSPERRWLVRRR